MRETAALILQTHLHHPPPKKKLCCRPEAASAVNQAAVYAATLPIFVRTARSKHEIPLVAWTPRDDERTNLGHNNSAVTEQGARFSFDNRQIPRDNFSNTVLMLQCSKLPWHSAYSDITLHTPALLPKRRQKNTHKQTLASPTTHSVKPHSCFTVRECNTGNCNIFINNASFRALLSRSFVGHW